MLDQNVYVQLRKKKMYLGGSKCYIRQTYCSNNLVSVLNADFCNLAGTAGWRL